ncbi:MAG: ATP-binding protein [Acidobacteriota bacterium]|nr:ATP-binding protein [Acidobacteriota bacterium]
MQKWRERGRRRRKKGPPSDVEATGRVGQPKSSDASRPAPLQPSYMDHFDKPAAAAAAPEAGKQEVEVETQPESPFTPPTQPSGAIGRPPEKHTAQAPRGVVVLAIGLPGSGKSTWFKRRGVTPLSSDTLRTLLFDDITEQRYQSLVFSTLRSILRARLVAKMPWNYVDATNLSTGERKQWIQMSRSLGYEVHAVFFDVPLQVCLERNGRRERVVAEDVMRRMAAKLKVPTFEEGFAKIVVVKVKQKAEE